MGLKNLDVGLKGRGLQTFGEITGRTYGFESGDTSRWDTVNDLSAVSNRVYTGSFAGKCNNAQNNQPQAAVRPFDGAGLQITAFEYYYQETKFGSKGSGIRLRNSNGDVEVGTATDNPSWQIDDGNGVTQVADPITSKYDQWYRHRLIFDWDAGTFTADFDQLNGPTSHDSSGRPLKHGVDIARIQIDDYNGGAWQDGGKIDTWFDDITVEL